MNWKNIKRRQAMTEHWQPHTQRCLVESEAFWVFKALMDYDFYGTWVSTFHGDMPPRGREMLVSEDIQVVLLSF